MRTRQIKLWPDGNYLGRINVIVGDVVMLFDVLEVYGFGDSRLLIQVSQIAVQVGVVHDSADIAFKVPVIDGVEAHESAKEPPVRFDNAIAEKVCLDCQALFQFIERVE
jgi:hypothetical protein